VAIAELSIALSALACLQVDATEQLFPELFDTRLWNGLVKLTGVAGNMIAYDGGVPASTIGLGHTPERRRCIIKISPEVTAPPR